MRPARFTDFVIDLAKNSPTASRVRTLADVGGYDPHLKGAVIATAAGESRWQFIGQLAPGEKHEHADTPATGTPVPVGAGPEPSDSPEAWLAATVARAESPEIASIERWSTREGERPGYFGMTVVFHNGARIFARQL